MIRFLVIGTLLAGAIYCFNRGAADHDPPRTSSVVAPAPDASPAPTMHSPAETSSEDDSPPLQIDAATLSMQYQRNEIAADTAYKGKTLEVSGIVSRIGKNYRDRPFLELATANRFEGVRADLQPNSEAFAATLSPGEPVTVLCRGAGMMIGSPILRECSIK